MKASVLLAAIMGAASSALSFKNASPIEVFANRRSSRARNIPDFDAPCFGDKLARKALKGTIGCRNGKPVPAK